MRVKMGHGGTLDPLATGVLILGVGGGTKSLPNFLGCTKSYEAVLLFGRATDSYDSVGKIVASKPFEHVTKDKVEEALGRFRGEIMQKPPIFSALRINGKRLYEYAREGKALPREIEERPVEVKELEMTEWLDGGTHEYHWPEEEALPEERILADQLLHFDGQHPPTSGDTANDTANFPHKRKRGDKDETVAGAIQPKRTKTDGASMASGGQQSSPSGDTAAETATSSNKRKRGDKDETVAGATQPKRNKTYGASIDASTGTPVATREPCPAPACRIRMTVTSGFYVRSLCHDLGAAVGSLGLMAALVRTRQGEFELGKNVFEYGDLAKGEHHWAPQVQQMLDDWEQGDHEGKVDAKKAIRDVVDDEQDNYEAPATRGSPQRDANPRRNSSSVEA